MGNWIKNPGTGENPIPGAKAGEFEVLYRDGLVCVYMSNADDREWETDYMSADVLEYRLIDKEHVLSSN